MTPEQVEYIVIHCSATKPSMDIGVQEIDKWHRQRGFHMVGYHDIIRRDGSIETGRPVLAYGAHAKGFNSKSISICMVGGIDESTGKPEDNFTEAQWESLEAQVLTLIEAYPQAKVVGHRDLPHVKKACPSFDVSTKLAHILN